MVPGQLIGKHSWKQGVQDLVDTVKVKHASGGWSTLGFKSYEQELCRKLGDGADQAAC
jgi:hypothetical protein